MAAVGRPAGGELVQRLLEEEALRPYVRLAESGALRHRRVAGAFPPTSEATDEIRRKCIDLLREALGMPALRLGGGEIPLQPAPEAATLSALARQLDQYLGGAMSPAQTRLTAVLALELDTAARSGELADPARAAPRPRAATREGTSA